MGDVLFVWTTAYQTCLKRACVPRLLSGLYQLFDLYLIKHVLIVWPLTSTLACLVTKQCLMVFGRQTFIVCPGPNTYFSCCLRFVSAADCQVSLPQHSSPECMAIRNAALAQNKRTFTLKQASHGFALLNMSIAELGVVALNDPFSSYYTRAYVGVTQANREILKQYNNATFGQEITDISEYLKMSQFFETVVEPAFGVSVLKSSSHPRSLAEHISNIAKYELFQISCTPRLATPI